MTRPLRLSQLLFAGVIAASFTFVAAAPARAQLYGQVLGGVTHAAQTEPFFAGAIGARITFVDVNVEVGRMMNILPKGLLDQLNELQREKGLPVQAIAELPATYVLGNIRIISPSGPVRPYVGGGIGVARIEPRFNVTVAGISLGDVFGVTSIGRDTRTMLAGGGGLRIDLGPKASLDLGYRYMRVLTDYVKIGDINADNVLTRVHSGYVGVGIKF